MSGSGVLGKLPGSMMALSPDGSKVIGGGPKFSLVVWDTATGIQITTIPNACKGLLWTVAFSPDGTQFASGGGAPDITLWSASTYKPVGTLHHGHWVRRLAFSPDGAKLLSGGEDGKVKLWDVSSSRVLGPEIATLDGHQEHTAIQSVAFSSDGSKIVTQGNKIWGTTSHKLLATLEGHDIPIRCATFSPDGGSLVSGTNSYITSWQRENEKNNPQEERPENQFPTVNVWNLASKKKVALYGHYLSDVSSVAFSPDGRVLALGTQGSGTKLLDATNNKYKQLASLEGEKNECVGKIAFSPDGSKLVAGSRIWDVKFCLAHPVRLHGKVVVFASLEPKRAQANTLAEKVGAKVAASMNGKTDYLVLGNKGTAAAREDEALTIWRIPILTEAEFVALCSHEAPVVKSEAPVQPKQLGQKNDVPVTAAPAATDKKKAPPKAATNVQATAAVSLDGKTVVFAGLDMSRAQANAMAGKAGAKVTMATSGNTNFLVYGPGAGDRREAAVAKMIALLPEAEFVALCRSDGSEEQGALPKKKARKE